MSGNSQNVGINSTGNPPNPSAGLDIDFPDKGLLIPRVSLTGTTSFAPLSAHVAGMVVYNTATAGDVVPGFYYNDGAKWVTGFPNGNAVGDMLYWTGSAWSLVPAGSPGQYLTLNASNNPYWATASTTGVFATITTNAATAITGTTATSGAVITSDGGSAILTRGICFATTPNPTTANSTVLANPVSGTAPYSCNLTALSPGTVYYARAYTINNSTVSYGNEITFTTLAVIPTMAATVAASAITANSATSGGNVTSIGGAPILERGICYGTTSLPTTANLKVVDPAPGIGAFVSNITGLNAGTTYYVRSYATNSAGTGYGSQISLITRPSVTSTNVATAITATSAVTGGTIAPFANSNMIWYYGVAYSTTSNAVSPTLVQSGTYPPVAGITYTTNISGLTANTLYYIRAYATGNGFTVYGPELNFSTTAPSVPVIASTTAITSITSNSAVSGGTMTSDGGAAITAKGVCWSTSPNPDISLTTKTVNGTGSAAFSSSITGLNGSTTYYVRAYATNSVGTAYGDELTFTTCGTPIYSIGQSVGGGTVFYVDCSGQHGLIISPSNQGTAAWGCSGTLMSTSATVGSGSSNTTTILAGCATRPIAASLARDYTGGGFTDWYLPSSSELSLMVNSGFLPAVQGAVYWSSTDGSSATTAGIYYYGNNWQVSSSVKTGVNTVRAIRSF